MEFICPRCGERGYLEQRRKSSNVYYYAVRVSCGGGNRRVRKLSGTQGIHRGRALQQAQPFRARGQGQDLEWLLEEVKKRIARKE
jgi:ribosomal protein L37E